MPPSTISLGDLLDRIDRLEAENATLRTELDELSGLTPKIDEAVGRTQETIRRVDDTLTLIERWGRPSGVTVPTGNGVINIRGYLKIPDEMLPGILDLYFEDHDPDAWKRSDDELLRLREEGRRAGLEETAHWHEEQDSRLGAPKRPNEHQMSATMRWVEADVHRRSASAIRALLNAKGGED